MFDFHTHPSQEKLNKEIALILGNTLINLGKISIAYDVDEIALINQYKLALEIAIAHMKNGE